MLQDPSKGRPTPPPLPVSQPLLLVLRALEWILQREPAITADVERPAARRRLASQPRAEQLSQYCFKLAQAAMLPAPAALSTFIPAVSRHALPTQTAPLKTTVAQLLVPHHLQAATALAATAQQAHQLLGSTTAAASRNVQLHMPHHWLGTQQMQQAAFLAQQWCQLRLAFKA